MVVVSLFGYRVLDSGDSVLDVGGRALDCGDRLLDLGSRGLVCWQLL